MLTIVHRIISMASRIDKYSEAILLPTLSNKIKGTSKNPTSHAELVSASPLYQGIADHVRNDDCAKSVVFRSPLKDQTMESSLFLSS